MNAKCFSVFKKMSVTAEPGDSVAPAADSPRANSCVTSCSVEEGGRFPT